MEKWEAFPVIKEDLKETQHCLDQLLIASLAHEHLPLVHGTL